MKTPRVAAGAAIGAVLSTVMTAFTLPWYISFAGGIVASALMCAITFGREKLSLFVRRFAVLWTVGMLLGGLMTFLMSSGTQRDLSVRELQGGSSALGFIPIAVLLCAVLVLCLSRVTHKKNVSITVSLFDKSVTLNGIIDSGNLLRDPISGEHVIIIPESTAMKLLTTSEVQCLRLGEFTDEHERIASRYRVVPASGVGGALMLSCIRPDNVRIFGKNCKAVIAVANDLKFGESTECIVPAALL